MELPTFPYAVLKSAPVPRTRSSPWCLGRRSATYTANATAGGGASRRPLDQERDDQDRDDVRDLDHRVDRRPGGVLVGVADGIARDRGRVRLGALPAVRAVLDQLLRVVPRATARGHRDGHEEADHDHA